VQTITSSVLYSSGSNIFGNSLSNTQVMTGSVGITGSLTLNNIAIPTSASLASTYLPLTGGTLTGALGGTSATFSGNVAVGQGSTGVVNIGGTTPSINAASFLRLQGSNTAQNYEISVNQYVANSISITPSTSLGGTTYTTPILTMSSTSGLSVTGAASFSGNVGIGTASPVGKLDINTGGNSNIVISNDSTDTGYNIVSLNGTRTKGSYAGIAGGGTADNNLYLNSAGSVIVQTSSSYTPRLTISNTGAATFETAQAINATFNSTNASGGYIQFSRSGAVKGYLGSAAQLLVGGVNDIELRSGANLFLTAVTDFKIYSRDVLALTIGASQAATFSSTIGTSGDITITKASAASFIANNTSASGKSYRLVSTDAGTFVIQNTGILDLVTITSAGAATFASSVTSTGFAVANTGGSINTSDIGAYVSLFGATGSPANTVIIGTASTERMRITSGGDVFIGTTTTGAGERLIVAKSEAAPLALNRLSSDGGVLRFYQDGTEEGNVTIAGTTVSYNSFLGSHWSQLQDGSKPTILKGTILEVIDELCVWENETNDRLPKSKISDTIESKNVYGIFLAWDEEWESTNDFFVAAVGLGYIRVHSSQNITIGDLLQSNGDGTAKIQSDSIMRSSTIAKVVSTQKIQTYEDSSYLIAATLHCG